MIKLICWNFKTPKFTVTIVSNMSAGNCLKKFQTLNVLLK